MEPQEGVQYRPGAPRRWHLCAAPPPAGMRHLGVSERYWVIPEPWSRLGGGGPSAQRSASILSWLSSLWRIAHPTSQLFDPTKYERCPQTQWLRAGTVRITADRFPQPGRQGDLTPVVFAQPLSAGAHLKQRTHSAKRGDAGGPDHHESHAPCRGGVALGEGGGEQDCSGGELQVLFP